MLISDTHPDHSRQRKSFITILITGIEFQTSFLQGNNGRILTTQALRSSIKMMQSLKDIKELQHKDINIILRDIKNLTGF